MRSIAVALFALTTSVLLATQASAAPRSCGTETRISRGAVFAIEATRARCPVARTVAGGWYNVQAHGDSARWIYDRKGRRWFCRITRRATGTDPGYNPYTHVRCGRKLSIVRFKLRS
jgi:hypothetical protein